MDTIQITRDSVSSDDELRGPHLMVARLGPSPTLGDLVEWVVSHHYLAGLPEGDAWVLHLGPRVGEPAAQFTVRVPDVPVVALLGDSASSLTGVGCVHLEWQPAAAHMED